MAVENPHIWLFNGKEPDGRYSVRGLSWVMREALKKTSIKKDVNLHSPRHTFATHLLEEGINIVTLKELLGHAEITTTMIYLHVAQCPTILTIFACLIALRFITVCFLVHGIPYALPGMPTSGLNPVRFVYCIPGARILACTLMCIVSSLLPGCPCPVTGNTSLNPVNTFSRCPN
jgi:hypothetical protein